MENSESESAEREAVDLDQEPQPDDDDEKNGSHHSSDDDDPLSTPPLLDAIGAAYALERSFWTGVLFSGVLQGAVLGLVGLGFFLGFTNLQEATWNQDEYKSALNLNTTAVESSLGLGEGKWWYVGLLSAGGAAVGAVKVLWTVVVRPFPAKPAGFLADVQNLSSDEPWEAVPIMLCSILSIGCGASCGPEMPLGAVGVAVGGVAVPFLSRKLSTVHQVFDLSGQEKLCALDGLAGAFGPLLPSQYLSPMLLHEVGKHWGEHGFELMETISRTGVASTISYAIFVGLKNRTILDTIPPPAAAYDLIETIDMVYLFYGAVLGVICGLLGLVGFVLMAICAKIGETVCQRIDRLGLGTFWEEEQEENDSKTPRTYLGMIATPTLGGCLVGLLAVACPLTLGDGSAQLNVILGNAETLGADTLIVSAIVKLVGVSISLGFGFIGGQLFPFLFTGACIGAAAHLVVPEVPLLISFPACMAATCCAFLPLTFTLTTFVSMTMALGGPATSPVFVAAVCSFTVVCGMGFLQGMIQRAMATKQSRAN